jgi:hypothetical protein
MSNGIYNTQGEDLSINAYPPEWEQFTPEITGTSPQMDVALTEPIPEGGYPCFWLRAGPVVYLRGYFSVTCSGNIGNYFRIALPFACPAGYAQIVLCHGTKISMARPSPHIAIFSAFASGADLTIDTTTAFEATNEVYLSGVVAPA